LLFAARLERGSVTAYQSGYPLVASSPNRKFGSDTCGGQNVLGELRPPVVIFGIKPGHGDFM
jgi:hypothetical protein